MCLRTLGAPTRGAGMIKEREQDDLMDTCKNHTGRTCECGTSGQGMHYHVYILEGEWRLP